MFTNSGSAHWQGGFKKGSGTVSLESGALADHPYGFNLTSGVTGTNPKELIGAALASCFSIELSRILEDAGVRDVTIDSTATVTLEVAGTVMTITKVDLATRITGDGAAEVIRKAANEAKAGCPVAKVLNADIVLDVDITPRQAG